MTPLLRATPFCSPVFPRLWRGLLLALLLVQTLRAGVASFTFVPPARPDDPLAREIVVEVTTPSGATLRLPAFFAGRDTWSVRARTDEPGTYRFGRVFEARGGYSGEIAVTQPSATTHTVTQPSARLGVRREGTRLVLSDGTPYIPLGANLAWAPHDRVTWHVDAFRQFEAEGLNWTRVWMCHWGGTNLDWLPDDLGRSPAPGMLDPRVADTWDRILDAAETHGVYVQLVLQHHGQYTTGANTNWADNPWNAANPGGFLASPGEFFTSPRAIALTKQKYRYVVARWAHSPAILAWELFNEVHWTNAYGVDRNEAAVAAWHTDMAAHLRSLDVYRHPVTTSLDDLRSPIYAAMDYYQPHLYAIDMLAGVRRFERPFAEFDRPVFFGEIGDDKMPVTGAEKSAGVQIVPQVWASLMGPGPLPGQSWLGDPILRTRRLGELGAVARFLRATGLAHRSGLVPFSTAVEGDARMPLVITPGHEWHRHVPATVAYPIDGRVPPAITDIPAVLVGAPESIADGFPPSTTLELGLPRATTATISFADAGARGAKAELLVDGTVVRTLGWSRLPNAPAAGPQPPDTPARPASAQVPLPAGARTLTIRNAGGADWIRLGSIDLQLDTPVLAAAGKRSADFLALWVWNKSGVHALTPPPAATATLVIPEVPAGSWTVTWWDAIEGQPRTSTKVAHAGGAMRLPTPPIERHAAVVLTR